MSFNVIYLGLYFFICVRLVGLMFSYLGQPQIGPCQHVSSLVGDDVTLPCHLLSHRDDAVDLTVEWSRPALTPRYVHVRRDGRDLQELQNPIYSSRTSLFLQELQYGNVSLKLSRVELSDAGNYTCFIPSLEEESVVELVVRKPQLVGLSLPVVALAGESAILPSYMDPPEDASEITIEWSKPDVSLKYIHLLRDGREITDLKNPSYRGRTELFTEELKKGNVSLKISRVTLTDEGHYRCFLPSKDRESNLQLIVGILSNPLIILVGIKDGGVVLQCESGGWYPEPEVEWLDSEGHVLTAVPTETVKDPDGTYTVRRLVIVYQSATNRFTCRVQQRHINQTREVHIYIPDAFFGCTSGCCWALALVLVLCIVVLVGTAAAVLFRKRFLKPRARNVKKEMTDVHESIPMGSGSLDEEVKGDLRRGKLWREKSRK